MRNMKKSILLLFVTLLATSLYAAGKYKLTAEAPRTVVQGDQFRITFTVNTSDNVKDFRGISNIDGLNVIFGPSTSRSSSMQIVNGKSTSSSSVTFTYMVEAVKQGTFTVPAATVVVDGEKLISNSLKIEVLPPDKNSSQRGQGHSSSQSSASQSSSVSADDLFVRVTASKTNVYEQEAFLLTYKVYYAVDLHHFENAKLPDFNGFHSQEIEVSQSNNHALEHYNGRNYHTVILKQYLLFPQRSGTLEIAPARFDAVVAKIIRSNDPFDAFFGGGQSYVPIKKTLTTPALKINVKALPSPRPESFIGAVGSFSLESSISKTDVNANDAVTYKLILSGVGNLKLVSAPSVDFPSDFDAYDPKVNENVVLKSNGMSGNRVFEYLLIPRHPGKYDIPSLTFHYFDTKSGSYKPLTTASYALNVGKSKGGSDGAASADYTGTAKEDVKMLASDIRYIKLGRVDFKPAGMFVVGSLPYTLSYVIPLVIFLIIFFIDRKNLSDSLNVAKSRNKKANRVVNRRMKQVSALLKAKEHDRFYDELLRALWGYMADKLNINTSDLNRDNIREKMTEAGLSEQDIADFINLLDECEFARYAPGDKVEGMDRTYETAREVIIRIENNMRK